MSTKNLALVFTKIPPSEPVPGEHLKVQDIGPFDLNAEPPQNGLTLEVLYSSFDPYLRGLLRDVKVKSYFPAVPLGNPLTVASLAKVLKSNLAGYAEGDVVQHTLPVAQYVTLSADRDGKPRKIDVQNGPSDIRHYLGALGMPGLTAYSSLYEIGQPKKGETIFISSAAGAVGQLVGQLAKHEGLTVLGSVGSQEKLDYITSSLGFDGGFNYKTESTHEALNRLTKSSKGEIDIYYDNVGGEQLSTALDHLSNHGRIVACGQISQYSLPDSEKYGVKNLMQIVAKRLTMRGFIVSDQNMGPKYAEEHQRNIAAWLKDGSFKAKIHEIDGIEKSAEGFVGMLRGENFGKAVLKVKQT